MKIYRRYAHIVSTVHVLKQLTPCPSIQLQGDFVRVINTYTLHRQHILVKCSNSKFPFFHHLFIIFKKKSFLIPFPFNFVNFLVESNCRTIWIIFFCVTIDWWKPHPKIIELLSSSIHLFSLAPSSEGCGKFFFLARNSITLPYIEIEPRQQD